MKSDETINAKNIFLDITNDFNKLQNFANDKCNKFFNRKYNYLYFKEILTKVEWLMDLNSSSVPKEFIDVLLLYITDSKDIPTISRNFMHGILIHHDRLPIIIKIENIRIAIPSVNIHYYLNNGSGSCCQ